jgi:hypothetical protein
MSDTKPKRGGKRDNAGRPIDDRGIKVLRSVTLDETTVQILKQAGRGNLSEGIRRAADVIDLLQRKSV